MKQQVLDMGVRGNTVQHVHHTTQAHHTIQAHHAHAPTCTSSAATATLRGNKADTANAARGPCASTRVPPNHEVTMAPVYREPQHIDCKLPATSCVWGACVGCMCGGGKGQ